MATIDAVTDPQARELLEKADELRDNGHPDAAVIFEKKAWDIINGKAQQ